MNIGKNIKKYRENKGLTQTELAEQLGISQPLIARYENDTKMPTALTIAALANVLNCTTDQIYGREQV